MMVKYTLIKSDNAFLIKIFILILSFTCFFRFALLTLVGEEYEGEKFTNKDLYILETKWGSKGKGDGQFYFPGGITIDPNGYIYVSDTVNSNIQKFDSNGNFITKWEFGSNEFGSQHKALTDIAVSPKGVIYAVANGSNCVYIANFYADKEHVVHFYNESKGLPAEEILNSPIGLAIDLEGSIVYVANFSNQSVQKFGINGFINQWGSPGNGDGQFDVVAGIAVGKDGYVYTIEWGNNRIQKFNSSGEFITKWPIAEPSKNKFTTSSEIDMDFDGNIYVPNYDNHYVQKFNSSGRLITQWGSFGCQDGQFISPIGAAVDKNGNVYVLDTGNYRIQKFAPVYKKGDL